MDPPHPVIVTIRDSRDYIRVLLYSYTTITGWGVLLRYARVDFLLLGTQLQSKNVGSSLCLSLFLGKP